MIQFIRFGTFLQAVLVQLFLLYYHGQLLIDSSTGIADGAFSADWCNAKNIRSDLTLIILRARRAKFLSAKKFSVISLESVTKVS
jgi:hypothetical protein